MKASPIQLLRLMFKHVKVELDPSHLPAALPNPLEEVFTFDGVGIQTQVGMAESEQQDNGRLYFLELQVVVDNQVNPDAAEQRFAPYTIDIAAEGVVLVPNGAEQLGPPDDLAVVNGTSLLWSAVREQVLALTARMRAGPVMLPTVHFHDLKQAGNEAAPQGGSPQEATAAPVPKKSARTKAAAKD